MRNFLGMTNQIGKVLQNQGRSAIYFVTSMAAGLSFSRLAVANLCNLLSGKYDGPEDDNDVARNLEPDRRLDGSK